MVIVFLLTLDLKFKRCYNYKFDSVMAVKNKNQKQKSAPPIGRQLGKQAEKEPDFYTKHKSTLWTVIVLIVLTIFFIINNTREVPDEGPYPPNYLKGKTTNDTSE